mmetsp:Transcript_32677/g.49938  ORF Transcript_32677/g.49938 Transcript_32677/m.49938 type:complete len:108 (+) Transcript_32677:3201-3524(+)
MASRVSLSTQNRFGSTHGWTHNDWVLVKIMAQFLQMNVSFFVQQVIQVHKKNKVNDVIDFATKMMNVRTFRQITKTFKGSVRSLLGFEACSVFFEDWATGDIFTVAD